MLFGRPNVQECTGEQWHKATGMPSFRLRVTTGVGGYFMQSGKMPYATAELGQQNMKPKVNAVIVFDPD